MANLKRKPMRRVAMGSAESAHSRSMQLKLKQARAGEDYANPDAADEAIDGGWNIDLRAARGEVGFSVWLDD